MLQEMTEAKQNRNFIFFNDQKKHITGKVKVRDQ